ncbi:MAG: quinol:cytochrome C oxidoreductase [Tepidisphaeraceae bacterium]
MTTHHPTSPTEPERLDLREHAWPLYVAAQVIGVIGLIVAILLGYEAADSFRRFFFAYLTAYCFFLTVALGGLFFTVLQFLVRGGWGVNVRRIAEWLASSLPLMAALSAPIVISILLRHGDLYPWSDRAARMQLSHFKQIYLRPIFVLARLAVYFAVWSAIGLWYWKQSTRQDATGDVELTVKMQARAAPCMVLFALTLTGAAFDLVMSLDPHWYSTILGVYFFAGSAVAVFAAIIVAVLLLQWRGFLRQSVTIEHFHDLGKYLFGFIFFWGYIAFSQYMLQWYGNMPEETEWYRRRGATTAISSANGWSVVILLLLFGHFLIPFAGLLSRHVKRSRIALGFWAVWMLAFHWLDMLWLVRPEMSGGKFDIGWIDLAVFLGIGGVFLAFMLRKAAHDALRPLNDPRLADSLAFENV